MNNHSYYASLAFKQAKMRREQTRLAEIEEKQQAKLKRQALELKVIYIPKECIQHYLDTGELLERL